MAATQAGNLIPILQVAIGPVILISGVGLLLLTLTNRFGRAVDRSRQLLREMRESPEPDRQHLARQVENLFRRARLIRLSITLAALSVLFAAVLVISLFFTALMNLEVGVFIGSLFAGAMLSLIASLGAFIKDIQLSLEALKLEMDHQPGQSA